MNIVIFLIPLALALGGGFALAFIISVYRRQYDDLDSPAHRILFDEDYAQLKGKERE
ncbi:MAG TPA: cbb3-type cytochrome oxidase assembly protein CcoS [Bdellovibrionales bacterium]|nr:cbb3-type cytochrome oxidase assembly protein CcoS [Bdellovibrionales bacterium]